MPPTFPTELVLAVVLQLAIVWALSRWGRWVSHRKAGGWRFLGWLPWLAFGFGVVGAATGAFLLVSSFSSVAAVDPSHKATVLASGISRAMTISAPMILTSWALYLTSIVLCIVGSVQQPRYSSQG